MSDELWRSIRKTTTQVHLEYGHANATLFATDIRLRRGPPPTLSLSLQSNLRTRNKSVGTYIDAKALAEGQISSLDRLQLLDTKVIHEVRTLALDGQPLSGPWKLHLELNGPHEYDVQPQFSTGDRVPTLFLVVRRV